MGYASSCKLFTDNIAKFQEYIQLKRIMISS